LKILHIVPTYIPAWRYGGPIRSVHGLCKALVNMGHEVDVYTTNVNGPDKTDVPVGIPVLLDGVKIFYFEVNLFHRIYFSFELRKHLIETIKNYDLVHLHSVFLWPTYFAAKLSRKNSIPFIISPRGMLVWDLIVRKSFIRKLIWILLFERKNMLRASCFHVTSELEAKELKKIWFVSSKKITEIPNAISKVHLHLNNQEIKEYETRLKKIGSYILYVGRLNWKKGIDRLIKSMTHIDNINLIIAGNDEENYTQVIEKLIIKYELENRIIIWGEVNEQQRTYLMQNAKLFVLASYSENFGNVILEALFEKCLVGLTKDVGLYKNIIEADAGIPLSNSPEKIAEEISFALSSEERLKILGFNGYKLVTEKFSWDSVAKEMTKTYESLLKEQE
jgi:glycosyltransferase involved in cell wall biosynthesis